MSKRRSSDRTKKIAVSAMLSALGIAVLELGSVIEVMDLTTVAIASLCVFFAEIEMGGSFPYLIYAVTGVLSFLLLPDKFAAVCYALFGGIYPVLKRFFERCPGIVPWILKLVYFNAVLALTVFISTELLGIEEGGRWYGALIYVIGNFTFILYDIAMTRLITLYMVKLRDRLNIGRYFKK